MQSKLALELRARSKSPGAKSNGSKGKKSKSASKKKVGSLSPKSLGSKESMSSTERGKMPPKKSSVFSRKSSIKSNLKIRVNTTDDE